MGDRLGQGVGSYHFKFVCHAHNVVNESLGTGIMTGAKDHQADIMIPGSDLTWSSMAGW